MKRNRLYALLFAVLTAIKLFMPYAPATLESGLSRLFGGSELTELAEALSRKITGTESKDTVSAAELTETTEGGPA